MRIRRKPASPEPEVLCSGERFVLRRISSEGYIGVWDRLDETDRPVRKFKLRQTKKALESFREWESEDQANPKRVVTIGMSACRFLGGYGYPLTLGRSYDIGCSEVGFSVWDESRRKVTFLPYETVTEMDVSGPTDPDSAGKRFGVRGPSTPILLSAVLHRVLSEDEIRTIVRLETTSGELVFHYADQSPPNTRGLLSSVFRHRMSAAALKPLSAAGRVSERLQRLADLRDRGLLTPGDQEGIAGPRADTGSELS